MRGGVDSQLAGSRRHGTLLGRAGEAAVLDDLVAAVRGGESRSLLHSQTRA
jgi:hypothetical protein